MRENEVNFQITKRFSLTNENCKQKREKKKRGKCHVRKRELVCFLFLAFFSICDDPAAAYSNRSLDEIR